MHVVRRIRMQVVMTVLGRPPQDALLSARLSEKRQKKLEYSTGLIGYVREIAVVASADGKDAQPVEDQAHRDCLPSNA